MNDSRKARKGRKGKSNHLLNMPARVMCCAEQTDFRDSAADKKIFAGFASFACENKYTNSLRVESKLNHTHTLPTQ